MRNRLLPAVLSLICCSPLIVFGQVGGFGCGTVGNGGNSCGMSDGELTYCGTFRAPPGKPMPWQPPPRPDKQFATFGPFYLVEPSDFELFQGVWTRFDESGRKWQKQVEGNQQTVKLLQNGNWVAYYQFHFELAGGAPVKTYTHTDTELFVGKHKGKLPTGTVAYRFDRPTSSSGVLVLYEVVGLSSDAGPVNLQTWTRLLRRPAWQAFVEYRSE